MKQKSKNSTLKSLLNKVSICENQTGDTFVVDGEVAYYRDGKIDIGLFYEDGSDSDITIKCFVDDEGKPSKIPFDRLVEYLETKNVDLVSQVRKIIDKWIKDLTEEAIKKSLSHSREDGSHNTDISFAIAFRSPEEAKVIMKTDKISQENEWYVVYREEDFSEDVGDSLEYRKDPYAHIGMKQSDFLQEGKQMKKDKFLLNERILGFAGITTPQSIGFASNSPAQQIPEQETPVVNEDDFTPQNFPQEEANKNAEMTQEYMRELNGPVPVAKAGVEGYEFEVYFQNGEIDDIEVVSGDFTPNVSMTRQLLDQGLPLGDAILTSKGRLSINESRIGKPHNKKIISERAMGMLGFVPLKPIGFASSAPTTKPVKQLREFKSDLSRNELYQYLPMIHSEKLMELADKFTESSAGSKWDTIVENLTEEYLNNAVTRKEINKTLQSFGIV